MMRKALFWTALVVAVVFAAGTGFAAPPDKVVFKAEKAKGPVAFDHKDHGRRSRSARPATTRTRPGPSRNARSATGTRPTGRSSPEEAFTPSARIATRRRRRTREVRRVPQEVGAS